MIIKLLKMREKYFVYEQEANDGPEDTHPGATGEDSGEEIIYKLPFLGRLRGGDNWITLSDNEHTHGVGVKVVLSVLLCEHIKWGPHEGINPGLEHENSREVCAFHPNQQRTHYRGMCTA